MKEKKILIVDDNPQFLQSLMMIIEMNGFSGEVAYAKNGAEALDYLFNINNNVEDINIMPKIIFLDLNIPEIDGFEVLRTFREVKGLENVPVVILTASNEFTDKEKALKLGATRYMIKPYDVNALLEVLETYVA